MRPSAPLFVLVLALAVPAWACPGTPPQIAVTTRERPAHAPPLPAGAAGHYRGTIATSYAVTTASVPDCARAARLAVTLTLTHGAAIARAHRATCRAPIIADHEAAHANADRLAMGREAERIRRDMGFLLSGAFRAPAEIEDAMALYFTHAAARLDADRQRLQSAVDSPTSYALAAGRALRCSVE